MELVERVDPNTIDWDAEADAVVLGLGAAGACAALAAAEGGASVLVLDRFLGGGATALSGGIVYAGGGTPAQVEAGVEDTPAAMLEYLRREVGDAVGDATLRRFCEGSVADVAWLTGHGVPFEGSLCPDKTSYPTNRHYLYYSGSELSGWGAGDAPPAPRGHRVVGRTMSGKVLARRLAAAVAGQGIAVRRQTRARRLLLDADGAVVGVRATTMGGAPSWARAAHRGLVRAGRKPYLYAPGLGRACYRLAAALERRHATSLLVRARTGVVIASGGFVADRARFRAHAPRYRGGMALGTPADDGAGISLGEAAGGAVARMERATAWRFLAPPTAFLDGLLVDRAGNRIVDESRYGAAVGDAILDRPDRAAWLVIDRPILRRAVGQIRRQTLWFQRLQVLSLLTGARSRGATLQKVAARAGVDPEGLRATLEEHNRRIEDGEPDPTGKPAALVRPIATPPYSLIDVSIRPRLGYPTPMLTLGGLVVDEGSGRVLRGDGAPVPGLWAVGRSAVGICSTTYVSGLSLADCVFSGRRAGAAVAANTERSSADA